MKLTIFILVLLGPSLARANCLPTPPYHAKMKILSCEEREIGQIFIRGELLEVSEPERPAANSHLAAPVVGSKYQFYVGQSPFKKNWLGQLKPREREYCGSHRVDAILTGVITKPCCDANYAWCDPARPVDFMVEED